MACDNFLWFPDAATGGILTKGGKAAQPQGETTDKWFSEKKAMELIDVDFGVQQAETTGSGTTGAGAGKANFSEFTINKFVDKASVPLFIAACAGAHFPNVMLAVRKVGGEHLVYLQYIFRQVFVIGIDWTGGNDPPKETIKFKFGAMGIQYVKQKPDGTAGDKIDASWSAVTNKPTLDIPDLAKAAPSYIAVSQAN